MTSGRNEQKFLVTWCLLKASDELCPIEVIPETLLSFLCTTKDLRYISTVLLELRSRISGFRSAV